MARLDLSIDVLVKGQNNLRGVANDLADVEGSAKKTETSLKGIAKAGAAFSAGFLGVQALAEGVQFLSDAVNKAAQFQDTVSATGVILGDQAVPAMEAFADSAASGFGASRQLALESANQMAIFGKSAGLVGDDLKDFATDLTQLGGDLASFFGGTTEDAIGAVQSALRGEFEPIRRYGVLLDDATLRQQAFEDGLIASTKQGLTPQIKVLAAQAAIFEQTADAQGDFARTSDGMANTQRELTAEFENVQEEIGEQLLPILVDVAHFIRDEGIPAFEGFIGAIETVGDGAENFRSSLGAFANDVGNIGVIVRNLITPWDGVNEAMTEFEDGNKRVLDAVDKHQDKFVKESAAAWQDYSESLSNAQFDADKMTQNQIDAMQAHWDEIRQAGTDMVVQYNVGIFEAQTSLQTEIDALLKVLDERLAPAEEIARLRGQKATLMLARGAAEAADDAPAVAAINEMIRKINAQINGLTTGAFDVGVKVVNEIVRGMKVAAALSQTQNDVYAIGGIIRDGVFIQSEPKDPNSPLRGITEVGGNIVHTITEGMMASLSEAQHASSALASALAVSPLTASALGPDVSGASRASGGLSGPSTGGVTVIINVEGDLKASEDSLPQTMHRAVYVAGLADEYER